MALLFMDGFEYSTTGTASNRNERVKFKGKKAGLFAEFIGSGDVGLGRRGGTCSAFNYNTIGFQSSGTSVYDVALGYTPTPRATLIFGYAAKCVLPLDANLTYPFVCDVWGHNPADPTTRSTCWSVIRDATGHLVLKNSHGVVVGTSTWVIPVNSWFFIEFKAYSHATNGSVIIRVDGVEVLNVQNIDTVTTAGYVQSHFYKCGVPVTTATSGYIDDAYICDDTTASFNDFIGDVAITNCQLVAQGVDDAFTASTSTKILNMKASAYGAANNSSQTLNDADTFTIANTVNAGLGEIGAVCVSPVAWKDDTTDRKVSSIVRIGGVDYAGTEHSILQNSSTQQRDCSGIFLVSPATSARWTKAELDASEFGYKVTT